MNRWCALPSGNSWHLVKARHVRGKLRRAFNGGFLDDLNLTVKADLSD